MARVVAPAATASASARRVAFLLGTGYSGEDVLQKAPVVEPLRPHAVYVASRIDPDVHLHGVDRLPVRGVRMAELRESLERLRSEAAGFEVTHRSPHLNTAYSDPERARLEAWLGVSLAFVASLDRRFFDARTLRETRDAAGLLQYVAGLVAFFRDFYARHRIDALVCTVEDAELTTTAHYVARRMGIPVVWTVPARFPRRGIMFYESFGPLLEWTDALADPAEVKGLYGDATIAGEALQLTRGYWDLSSLPRRLGDALFAGAYQSYRAHVVRHHPREGYAIPPLHLGRRLATYATKVLRRYGVRAVARRPPPGEDYVLFPLHYLEDAHMSFREPFLDQFQLIKQLARALPTGHWLYVKPHPHYFGTDMSYRELAAAARLPHVRVLDPRLPPGALARAARAVVTVNSTLGFEALVHGVPVVTLGRDFYCREPYCDVVRDRNELSEALTRATARGTPPDPEATRTFVRRVHANSVWVEGRDHGYGLYGFTEGDGERVAHALGRIVAGLPPPSPSP